MVDVGDPVAGITIERRFAESMGLRVEGGRVAAGAFQRKLVVFPSGFVWLLNRVFAVPVLLQRPRVIRLRADEVVAVIVDADRSRVGVLLPRVGDRHAVAEQALLAGGGGVKTAARGRLPPAEKAIVLWAIKLFVQLLDEGDLAERKRFVFRHRIDGEPLQPGQPEVLDNRFKKRGRNRAPMDWVEPEVMGSHLEVGRIRCLDDE